MNYLYKSSESRNSHKKHEVDSCEPPPKHSTGFTRIYLAFGKQVSVISAGLCVCVCVYARARVLCYGVVRV